MSKTKINIRRLKKFAFNELPDGALRQVLLIERDELECSVFLNRLPVWLKLSRLPGKIRGNG